MRVQGIVLAHMLRPCRLVYKGDSTLAPETGNAACTLYEQENVNIIIYWLLSNLNVNIAEAESDYRSRIKRNLVNKHLQLHWSVYRWSLLYTAFPQCDYTNVDLLEVIQYSVQLAHIFDLLQLINDTTFFVLVVCPSLREFSFSFFFPSSAAQLSHSKVPIQRLLSR